METGNKPEQISAKYAFYGHEKAAAIHAAHKPASGAAAGIDTPLDLYDALSEIWCADTCAPRMRADWTPENRTLGQCSITAFLAQDIFGGEVRGIPLNDGGVHCYNVVDGIAFDLTSEQFGERAKELDYADEVSEERKSAHQNPLQERESPQHFGKAEKRARYEYLRNALQKSVFTLPSSFGKI